jgi:hypothetical protein
MLTKKITTSLFAAAILVGLVNLTPQIARAQICASSNLTYVVRDAKGVIIDPRGANFRYALEGWEPTKQRLIRVEVPQQLSGLEKAVGLQTWGQCSFQHPVTLKLTLEDKSMNLIFRASPLGGYRSANYLVDSLPFQQGTFEIDLPMPPDASGQFYAASGWKKTSSDAEAVLPPTLMFIRGRVVDAVTKNPVAGARVSLIGLMPTELKDRGKAQTNRDGAFAMEGLRSDYMAHVYQAALTVEHPDFGSRYILIFNGDKRSAPDAKPVFTSTDQVVVELVPMATVSGRLIDAATGNVPTELDQVVLTFRYRESGYLGGNIQFPDGEVKVKPNADGTFTAKAVMGKNRILAEETWHAGGCGKCYYMGDFDDDRLEIDVPKTGQSGLVLKLKVHSK